MNQNPEELFKIVNQRLDIGRVECFTFPGTNLNNINFYGKKLNKSLTVWIRAYHAKKNLFNSKTISQPNNNKLYGNMNRAVIPHGSVAWTLTITGIFTLKVCEQKIIMKMHGLVKEEEIWTMRNNREVDAKLGREDIIRLINP